MKIKTGLLLALLLASVSCFAAQTYQVSTSVFKNGELIASPVMVVEAEKMASISIGSDFSYNLTVIPNQDQTASIITAVTVGDDTVQPELIVIYDKEATMEIGDKKLTLLVSKVGS